jgi:membrane protease YdiL (CAAX protease family)
MSRTPAGRLNRFAARRPLTAFLGLGLGGAYLLSGLWGLAYHGFLPGSGLADALRIAPDEVTGALLVTALLPTALYVTWATDGRDGVRALLRRVMRWRVSPVWWLLVITGLPGLTIGLALLSGDQLKDVSLPSLLPKQVVLLLINLLVINLWEETAWAGVVQTRLERRHSLFTASVLTALPFAAVHVPLEFFLDEPVTAGSLVGAFISYFILGLLVRPLFAVVLRATGDSLLLVGLMHAVFNRTNNENGIAAKLLEGDARQLTALVAVILLAVAIAVRLRPEMRRVHRLDLDRESRAATNA